MKDYKKIILKRICVCFLFMVLIMNLQVVTAETSCEGEVMINDFKIIEYVYKLKFTDFDATTMRYVLDNMEFRLEDDEIETYNDFGEISNDDKVTTAEVKAMEDWFEKEFQRDLMGIKLSDIEIDGEFGIAHSYTLVIQNAEGACESTLPLTFISEFEIRFNNVDASANEHILKLTNTGEVGGQFTIVAPKIFSSIEADGMGDIEINGTSVSGYLNSNWHATITLTKDHNSEVHNIDDVNAAEVDNSSKRDDLLTLLQENSIMQMLIVISIIGICIILIVIRQVKRRKMAKLWDEVVLITSKTEASSYGSQEEQYQALYGNLPPKDSTEIKARCAPQPMVRPNPDMINPMPQPIDLLKQYQSQPQPTCLPTLLPPPPPPIRNRTMPTQAPTAKTSHQFLPNPPVNSYRAP
jgi:hypothetical protein